MRNHHHFYIDGQWVAPANGGEPFEVINPATGKPAGTIRLGGEADVERAVTAARRAFDGYSRLPLAERKALLASALILFGLVLLAASSERMPAE